MGMETGGSTGLPAFKKGDPCVLYPPGELALYLSELFHKQTITLTHLEEKGTYLFIPPGSSRDALKQSHQEIH